MKAKKPIPGYLSTALSKKRLYHEVLKEFLLLLVYCLPIICFLRIFYIYESSQYPIEIGIHAVEDYKKWGVSIMACKESFFAESDHTAFNEGFRYSVLSGPVGIGSRKNSTGKSNSTTAGFGRNENVNSFLADVWLALDIPMEKRFSLKNCRWMSFKSENGSRLVVVKSTSDPHAYVIEMLL